MRTMRSFYTAILHLIIPAILLANSPDVTKKHSTQVKLKGTLGTMMKLFGGNKPTYHVEYLHGNMKRIDNVDKKGKIKNSQIIDLERGLFINIDYKKKKYTEMTFEQWKEMMKSGLSGILGGNRDDSPESDQPEQEKPEVKLKFDVKVERPGDTKKIANHETEKIILTLKAEADVEAKEKDSGEKVKGRGGMILRSTNWVAKSLQGRDEEMAFNKKLAEKLGMELDKGGLAGIMNTIMEKNPDLAAALEKLQEESKKLEGVILLSESVVETWGEPNQKMNDQEEPKSVGGLFKGLGKKFGKKKKDGPNTLIETTNKTSKYSNDPVKKDSFGIPANFEKEEVKMPNK
ncbi:MAG: hypothetical protein ACE5I1_07660 [bacterium]